MASMTSPAITTYTDPYLLGGMLGRHQNQVGFLYSSAPLVAGDFDSGQAGHKRVFLGPERGAGGSVKESRYLLSWFTVVGHLTPQLIEVGSAPD